MVEKTLHLLIKRLHEYGDQALGNLSSGQVKDYAEYRELVGLIRGLRLAVSDIEDLLRNFEDQEDE